MSFKKADAMQLNLGVNLRGLTGGVNVKPGQAQDAVDVLPREDGGIFKVPGWFRINTTALSAPIVAHYGFAYRGKNNADANPDRPGNFGLLDDGAQFTLRREQWTTAVVMTETEFRFFNPATLTYDLVALPGGVSVDRQPKPTAIAVNNNLYIVGFASHNLRYDPVDRARYLWDWDSVPAVPAGTLAAGGTLAPNAVYKYAASWFDVYTGEESEIGTIQTLTTTTANRTVNFAAASFANYAGTRHFVAAGTNRDVGLVLYRTEADTDEFHFLTTLLPDLTTATVNDNGLVTDDSLKPERIPRVDAPRFNAITLFRDQWYAVSWDTNPTRVYYNDFRRENSFYEGWHVLNFFEAPLADGEILIGPLHSDMSLLAFSQLTAYIVDISITDTGRISRSARPLGWTVGAVGPKAMAVINGWVYFLSERGPYRWREGLSEPQWIGRDLLPLFIDPTSGMCKLAPAARLLSEVAYDQTYNVVRWQWATGESPYPNHHWCYWIHDDIPGMPDPAAGWFAASPKAQCFDFTNALEPLRADGRPSSPFDKHARFVFGDRSGFVNAYELSTYRAGLPNGVIARGLAQGGSGAATLVATTAANPLYTTGSGMAGLRVEVVHANAPAAPIEVRQIVSNTTTTITVDINWQVTPVAGDTWYVAGIPAFWRSWPDHAGDPDLSKGLMHLFVGMVPTFFGETGILDVNIAAGDFPTASDRYRSMTLDGYRDKHLVSLSGRWFTYDLANTRPDEPFAVTRIAPEYEPRNYRKP